MSRTFEVAVDRLQEIAEEYNYEQVIVIGYNTKGDPAYQISTHGVDEQSQESAERGRNFITEAIGWDFWVDRIKIDRKDRV